MAYDTKILFEKAKQEITSKKLIFVEEVASFIGVAKPTFYEHFPIDSNEMNELKRLIETNKISLKTSMRKKWYDSDNPTLQMGLMKLLASAEEHKKLSQNYTDHTTDGKAIAQTNEFTFKVIDKNDITE